MPKVKLMSDLSMRLGKDASPMVAQFSLTAYPSELSGDINICDITYLSSDIDEWSNESALINADSFFVVVIE